MAPGRCLDVPRESNDAGFGEDHAGGVERAETARCQHHVVASIGGTLGDVRPRPCSRRRLSPRVPGALGPGGVARRRVPANRGSRGRPRRARRRVPRRPRRRICAGRPARRTTTLGVTRGRRTRTRRAGPARAWTRGWSLDDSASRRTSLAPRGDRGGDGRGRSGAVGGAAPRGGGSAWVSNEPRGRATSTPRAPPTRTRASRRWRASRYGRDYRSCRRFPQISISARETMRAERAHPRDRDPRVDEDGDHF